MEQRDCLEAGSIGDNNNKKTFILQISVQKNDYRTIMVQPGKASKPNIFDVKN